MSVLNTHNGYEFPNLSTNCRELQGTFENHLPIVMRKLARRLIPVAADGQLAMVLLQHRTASDGFERRKGHFISNTRPRGNDSH